MATTKNPEDDWKQLRDLLKQTRNFALPDDLIPELEKACSERLGMLKLASLPDYLKYLQSHEAELNVLLDVLFASRCQFFGDGQDWQILRDQILPQVDKRHSTRDLRFWAVNCGTGQEAYSLAILLCEFFGEKIFQERIKIFCTDADEHALQVARAGKYSETELAGLASQLRNKYFTPSGDVFVFRDGLRSSLTFGRHVLNEDPVMSRMDLILCRHVMPYFSPAQQSQIISRMLPALRAGGWLCLGRGEEPTVEPPMTRVPSEASIFSRTSIEEAKAHLQHAARSDEDDLELAGFYSAACEHSPVATIGLDYENRLAIANARARLTFGLLGQDLGRPLKDLEISYRPIDLRSLLDQSARDNRPIITEEVSHHLAPGRAQMFSVHIYPLVDATSHRREGFSIQFHDVTELHDAKSKLTTVNQQLQTANEELQSSHEELETTNEELQSSNEELETANEELQSTNEELETMNEELHSTNSELESANSQQRELSDSVQTTGAFLDSILSGMKSALIVLDENLDIKLWNDQCRNLWGLRADEVKGHSFFALDIGLPVDRLKPRLWQFLQSKKHFDQVSLDAMNRRGKPIRCTVSMTPFISPGRHGVVLLIDETGSTSGPTGDA